MKAWAWVWLLAMVCALALGCGGVCEDAPQGGMGGAPAWEPHGGADDCTRALRCAVAERYYTDAACSEASEGDCCSERGLYYRRSEVREPGDLCE